MALQFSVAGGNLTEISQISQMPPQHLVLVGSMWQSCCVLTLVGGNLTGRHTTLQPWCSRHLSLGLLTDSWGCRLLGCCARRMSRAHRTWGRDTGVLLRLRRVPWAMKWGRITCLPLGRLPVFGLFVWQAS